MIHISAPIERATLDIVARELLNRVSSTNRRRTSRFNVVKPVVAIPVRANGRLAPGQLLHGYSADLSPEGIGVELDGARQLPSQFLLVGVENLHDGVQYAGVQVRNQQSDAVHGCRLGTEFRGPAHDLLDSGNLTPVFDPQTSAYCFPYPQYVYDEWVRAGILRPVVKRHAELCPTCSGVAVFRRKCGGCRRNAIAVERHARHVACGHADLKSQFGDTRTANCPGCRRQITNPQQDLETFPGPFRCQLCSWSGYETESVGNCLCCGECFPGNSAYRQPVIGYEVKRLDPQTLVVPE